MSVAAAVLGLALGWGSAGLYAQPGVPGWAAAQSLPTELRSHLPSGQLAGRARLSVWGFQIYDATLWVAPDFKARAYENHAFALELAYLRPFTSREIAQRSLVEMSRQGSIGAEQSVAWERQLQEVIPDVQPGDRLAGIYQPGLGGKFLVNGKLHKTLADVQLTKRFFGIWLSEATSEPAMRRELMSLASP